MKRALVLVLAVGGLLVLIGSASGAGPSPGVTFGSPGVVSHDVLVVPHCIGLHGSTPLKYPVHSRSW